MMNLFALYSSLCFHSQFSLKTTWTCDWSSPTSLTSSMSYRSRLSTVPWKVGWWVTFSRSSKPRYRPSTETMSPSVNSLLIEIDLLAQELLAMLGWCGFDLFTVSSGFFLSLFLSKCSGLTKSSVTFLVRVDLLTNLQNLGSHSRSFFVEGSQCFFSWRNFLLQEMSQYSRQEGFFQCSFDCLNSSRF